MKRKSPRKPKQALKNKTVLLCVSGSIAAYRACDVVRELKAEGADVFCLMTEAAKHFVSPLTFHSLSGHPVYSDPFSNQEDWAVLHTNLADRADLILMVPATADLLARMAHGFANDLVTSVLLASKAPVLIAPAMNDHMFSHPMTQENIKKLSWIGYQFIDPIEGDLVCGRIGMGHIQETEVILKAVRNILHVR